MTDAPMPAFDYAAPLGPEARRSPEMEEVWAWLVEQDAGLPNWLTLPPAEARALHDGLARRWNSVLPDVAQIEALAMPGSPSVSGQLIVPHDAHPGCILFLHGGGWAFGNLATHQRLMRLLAIACRRPILGLDYRLAPEHPFPAAVEDSIAAWTRLSAHPEQYLNGPLLIAGDSAGANLSMAVILDAAAQNTPRPDAALLFYGVYSADLDSPSQRRFSEGYGLTRAAMIRFWNFYAPEPRSDPRLAAINAPDALLSRSPPLYLNAAGLDPLLCDTLDLVKRLDLLGVPHEFVLHPSVHHGFMQMSLRLHEAQRAIDRAGDFVRRRFDAR